MRKFSKIWLAALAVVLAVCVLSASLFMGGAADGITREVAQATADEVTAYAAATDNPYYIIQQIESLSSGNLTGYTATRKGETTSFATADFLTGLLLKINEDRNVGTDEYVDCTIQFGDGTTEVTATTSIPLSIGNYTLSGKLILDADRKLYISANVVMDGLELTQPSTSASDVAVYMTPSQSGESLTIKQTSNEKPTVIQKGDFEAITTNAGSVIKVVGDYNGTAVTMTGGTVEVPYNSSGEYGKAFEVFGGENTVTNNQITISGGEVVGDIVFDATSKGSKLTVSGNAKITGKLIGGGFTSANSVTLTGNAKVMTRKTVDKAKTALINDFGTISFTASETPADIVKLDTTYDGYLLDADSYEFGGKVAFESSGMQKPLTVYKAGAITVAADFAPVSTVGAAVAANAVMLRIGYDFVDDDMIVEGGANYKGNFYLTTNERQLYFDEGGTDLKIQRITVVQKNYYITAHATFLNYYTVTIKDPNGVTLSTQSMQTSSVPTFINNERDLDVGELGDGVYADCNVVFGDGTETSAAVAWGDTSEFNYGKITVSGNVSGHIYCNATELNVTDLTITSSSNNNKYAISNSNANSVTTITDSTITQNGSTQAVYTNGALVITDTKIYHAYASTSTVYAIIAKSLKINQTAPDKTSITTNKYAVIRLTGAGEEGARLNVLTMMGGTIDGTIQIDGSYTDAVISGGTVQVIADTSSFNAIQYKSTGTNNTIKICGTASVIGRIDSGATQDNQRKDEVTVCDSAVVSCESASSSGDAAFARFATIRILDNATVTATNGIDATSGQPKEGYVAYSSNYVFTGNPNITGKMRVLDAKRVSVAYDGKTLDATGNIINLNFATDLLSNVTIAEGGAYCIGRFAEPASVSTTVTNELAVGTGEQSNDIVLKTYCSITWSFAGSYGVNSAKTIEEAGLPTRFEKGLAFMLTVPGNSSATPLVLKDDDGNTVAGLVGWAAISSSFDNSSSTISTAHVTNWDADKGFGNAEEGFSFEISSTCGAFAVRLSVMSPKTVSASYAFVLKNAGNDFSAERLYTNSDRYINTVSGTLIGQRWQSIAVDEAVALTTATGSLDDAVGAIFEAVPSDATVTIYLGEYPTVETSPLNTGANTITLPADRKVILNGYLESTSASAVVMNGGELDVYAELSADGTVIENNGGVLRLRSSSSDTGKIVSSYGPAIVFKARTKGDGTVNPAFERNNNCTISVESGVYGVEINCPLTVGASDIFLALKFNVGGTAPTNAYICLKGDGMLRWNTTNSYEYKVYCDVTAGNMVVDYNKTVSQPEKLELTFPDGGMAYTKTGEDGFAEVYHGYTLNRYYGEMLIDSVAYLPGEALADASDAPGMNFVAWFADADLSNDAITVIPTEWTGTKDVYAKYIMSMWVYKQIGSGLSITLNPDYFTSENDATDDNFEIVDGVIKIKTLAPVCDYSADTLQSVEVGIYLNEGTKYEIGSISTANIKLQYDYSDNIEVTIVTEYASLATVPSRDAIKNHLSVDALMFTAAGRHIFYALGMCYLEGTESNVFGEDWIVICYSMGDLGVTQLICNGEVVAQNESYDVNSNVVYSLYEATDIPDLVVVFGDYSISDLVADFRNVTIEDGYYTGGYFANLWKADSTLQDGKTFVQAYYVVCVTGEDVGLDVIISTHYTGGSVKWRLSEEEGKFVYDADYTAPVLDAAYIPDGYTWDGKWYLEYREATGDYVVDESDWLTPDTEKTVGGYYVYVALLTPIPYSFTYDYDGATGGNTATSVAADFDSAAGIQLAVPTKTGYTFTGWFFDSEVKPSVQLTGADGVTDLAIDSDAIAMFEAYYPNVTDDTYPLTAHWEPNSYTVEYDKNDASATGTMDNQNFVYGVAQALRVNGYSKEGYLVGGWATSADGDIVYDLAENVTNVAASGTVILYAVWVPISYSVEFHANGADTGNMDAQVHTYDTAKNLSANLYEKPHYSFEGWSTTETGEVEYTDGQSVENLASVSGSVKHLYAVWTPDVYTLTYENLKGADNSNAATHTYDTATPLTALSNVTGYTFEGWALESDGATVTEIGATAITSNQKVYAKWTPKTYTISYDNTYGATNGNATTHTYGTATPLSAPGSVAGYSFIGWSFDPSGASITEIGATAITEDKTVYAKWSILSYTVSYELGGGTVDPANRESYNVTHTFTLTNPTREGYEFAGWTTDGETAPKMTVTVEAGSTGDVTFTAHWTANTYTVTYNVNGGNALTPATTEVTFGAAYTLATPTHATKYFGGWYNIDDSVDTAGNWAIAADVTLVAHWNDYRTYQVTFNGGTNATGSVAAQNVREGDNLTLPANGFERVGYSFDKWSDGTNTYAVGATYNVTADAAFTATWTANTNTSYVVRHYQQNLVGDEYTLADTDYPVGTTDTNTAAVARSYIGFAVQEFSQKTIAGEGNTVVNVYYDRVTCAYEFVIAAAKGSATGTTSGNGRYGFTPAAPTVVANDGYTFTGWSPEVTALAEASTTFTAQFTLVTYDISYELNGGAVAANPATYNIETATFTLNNPTRTGYEFAGWTYGTVTTPDTSVSVELGSTGDVTFIANWTAASYTVRFMNGESVVDSTTYVHGATVVAPANPSKAADNTYTYEFARWDGYTTGATATENRDYAAVFTPVYINYTVTFVNGTATVATRADYHYGDTVTVPTAPEKAGHRFDGWTPAVASTVSGNATYTAVFVKVYTVVVEGGKIGDGTSASVDENGTVTLTLDAVPEGKEFMGWKIGGNIISIEPNYTFTPTSDVAITALFEDAAPVEDGLGGGAIAGIVVGGTAFVSLGGFAIFWFLIKKRSFGDLMKVFKK